MTENELILDPFEKALTSLKRALSQPKDEYTRDAAIQRFEYTYELCWKMLKRYLALEAGIKEHNIKNLYREGGRQGLIKHVEKWFEYHTARNLTSHTYNEITAEETYEVIKEFSGSAEYLLQQLKSTRENRTE